MRQAVLMVGAGSCGCSAWRWHVAAREIRRVLKKRRCGSVAGKPCREALIKAFGSPAAEAAKT